MSKPNFQTYLVGGAVRDKLLGLAAGDQDYVVVGAQVQDMLDAGYKPVGKDFPVFLHPETHCEYALARTERKSGKGYAGFTVYAAPEVSLEEDLIRRDLTINAMAQDEHGHIIDPYGGQSDLKQKVFRHVSPAFAEDPLRILRVARFAARLTEFTVATETLELMRHMVDAGEAKHLVAERVWQELSRGLMEAAPRRMFEVLDQCGALDVLLPELKQTQKQTHLTHTLERLRYCPLAAQPAFTLAIRWAALCLDIPFTIDVHERLRVPILCKDLAKLAHTHAATIHNSESLSMSSTLDLLQKCDALRKVERFSALLDVCQADWLLQSKSNRATTYAPKARLTQLLHAALNIDSTQVIAELHTHHATVRPQDIALHIAQARIKAMTAACI